MSLSIPPYSVTSYKMHGSVWKNPLFSLFQTPPNPIFKNSTESTTDDFSRFFETVPSPKCWSVRAVQASMTHWQRTRFGSRYKKKRSILGGLIFCKRNKLRDQHRFFSSFVGLKKNAQHEWFFSGFVCFFILWTIFRVFVSELIPIFFD